MGRVLLCGDHGLLVTPNPDCPNAASHQPCPAGYIAWHTWAEAAMQVATQAQCPSCGLWRICTPKRPDLRIATVWPVPDCMWADCGAEGVGERLSGVVWVPVCADHTGISS